MYRARTKTAIALATALLTASCATGPDGRPQGVGETFKSTFASDDPCSNNARNLGVVGGVVAGVIVGKVVGAKGGQMVAAAGVGALMGGLIGADMDRRRCDLSKIAKAHNLDIVMTDITMKTFAPTGQKAVAQSALATPGDVGSVETKAETVGMSLTVFDHGSQFALGSAEPSPSSIAAFGEVAEKYRAVASGKDPSGVQAATERVKKMRILLVGHTDDTGSSQLNADLSEARARSIARIFAAHGFSEAQIFYQGAGEVFPLADNRTEDGRARNRRVEVVDLGDEAVFAAFLDSRRPNVARYRPSPTIEATSRIASSRQVEGKAQAATRVATAIDTTKPAKADSALKAAPVVVPNASVRDSSAAVTTSLNASPGRAGKAPPAASTGSVLAPPSSDGLDFGGQPFDAKRTSVDIGKLAHSGGFSIISTAYASDDAPLGTCATDHPRISSRVKSLSTGRDIKSAEYLPGTAVSSWGGKVNGHMVGLSGVAVLRDGGQPATRPTLYIWKNYADGSVVKADVKTTGDVNAYQGEKALLYRVFPTDGPLRCIDMVIPNSAPSTAPASSFVYVRSNALYQSEFSPAITR